MVDVKKDVRYELTLYSGIKPNEKGHTHYIYDAPQRLLEKLIDYEALTLEPTRYSYVNNSVVIADTEAIDYKTITYIAIKKFYGIEFVPREVNFYFVNSAKHYSRKYYFNTELDIFATYIAQASINSIFINRCNKNLLKNINSGYIEPIKETRVNSWVTDYLFKPLGGEASGNPIYNKIKLENLNVLVIANNVVGQNPVTQEYATTTQAYTINLKTLIDVYRNSGDTYDPDMRILDVMQSLISNIKGFNDLKFEFNILNCYLLPSDWVFESNKVVNVVSQLPWTGQKEYSFQLTLANCNHYLETFDFKYDEIDHNFKYYLGTFDNGIEYTDYLGVNQIIFEISYTNTGCEIKVKQGDNVKDITSSFTFSPNGNSKNNDILEKIAIGTNAMASALKTANSIMKVEDPTEAKVVGAAEILGQFGRLGKRANAQGQGGNSNAITTYSYNGSSERCSDDFVIYPLILFGIRAEKNIGALIRLNGAIYNEYFRVRTLNLPDYEFLGVAVPYIEESNFTYIQAIIDFDNLQLDAEEFIEAEFANGLYYEYL